MLVYLSMIQDAEEQDKFVLLYETYQKRMFRVANNILHDTYMAEDIVHQAFIKILTILDTIRTDETAKTKNLVTIIARNLSYNHYRYLRNHCTISYDELEFELPSENDFNIYEENFGILDAAIARLPKAQQDVLYLKYVHNYSDAIIANVLSVGEAAVRKRMQRAREKLRELLNDSEGFSYRS